MADRIFERGRRAGQGSSETPEPEQSEQSRLRERALLKRAQSRGEGKGAAIPEGGGKELPAAVRARMEPRLGTDLGGVQVHTDGAAADAAQDLGARAFTVDNHIHFNQGEFAPGTREGDRLIAHELMHVKQGQTGEVHRKAQEGQEADDGNSALEQAADSYADQVTDELNGDGDKDEKGEGDAAKSANPERDEQVVQGVMAAEECDRSTATKIKDELLVAAGETLGVAEILGLRYKVTPYEAQVSGELFRGSRVDGKGMAALKAQGINGIVSFCLENNDDAKPADALGLKHLRIPILDNSAPNEGQVREFLQFVKDSGNQPVYCHCEAGKGRTGTMVACYRIAVDGWSAEQAIAEGKSFGLELINQIKFIEKFAEDVASGAFAS
jgi:hypothetical protein